MPLERKSPRLLSISFTINEQQCYVNVVINKQLLLLFTPCTHYKICVRNFQRNLRTLQASAENIAGPLKVISPVLWNCTKTTEVLFFLKFVTMML